MTVIRTLKKLLFGETWLLPGSLAAAFALTLLLRHLLEGRWDHAGGFVLLAAVIVSLMVSVQRSARAR